MERRCRATAWGRRRYLVLERDGEVGELVAELVPEEVLDERLDILVDLVRELHGHGQGQDDKAKKITTTKPTDRQKQNSSSRVRE